MVAHSTLMAQEAAEAPQRIAAMRQENQRALRGLAERLRAAPPRLLMTCARGSSDHAATYLQALSHLYLGIPALSLPPSVASVYDAPMDLSGVLFVAISQSGRSPDLVAGATWAARHGAEVLALVNDANSPLAAAAQQVLPLAAGPELSVAATKSYLASLAMGLELVAGISGDPQLARASASLPEMLSRAMVLDWSAALPAFAGAHNAYVVGRGPGFGPASEMALKLKETSVLHAEAFSSAEIMHGPLGVLHDSLPVLLTAQNDKALAGARRLHAYLEEKGVPVCAAYEGAKGPLALPVLPGLHPAAAPIAAVQTFYGFAAALAVRRGRDPDRPKHLQKVTETQ